MANCNLQEKQPPLGAGCLSQAAALQIPSVKQFTLEKWRSWGKRSESLMKLVGCPEELAKVLLAPVLCATRYLRNLGLTGKYWEPAA